MKKSEAKYIVGLIKKDLQALELNLASTERIISDDKFDTKFWKGKRNGVINKIHLAKSLLNQLKIN